MGRFLRSSHSQSEAATGLNLTRAEPEVPEEPVEDEEPEAPAESVEPAGEPAEE